MSGNIRHTGNTQIHCCKVQHTSDHIYNQYIIAVYVIFLQTRAFIYILDFNFIFLFKFTAQITYYYIKLIIYCTLYNKCNNYNTLYVLVTIYGMIKLS